MTAAEVLAKHGTLRAAEVVELAAAAGLELAAAATLLEKESSGGQNVFGNDNDNVKTGGFYTKRGPVTEEAYRNYKAHRHDLGNQGVGPTQLTSPGLQDRADALGKHLGHGGCWEWRVNCQTGFEILAEYITEEHDVHEAFRRYNGAEAYADDAVKKLAVWRTRLAGVVGEEDMPLNDADKTWLKNEIRDAVNDHADKLFRFADHGGGDPPTAAPPNHPHNHKAILDRLDEIERRLPGSH